MNGWKETDSGFLATLPPLDISEISNIELEVSSFFKEFKTAFNKLQSPVFLKILRGNYS